MTLIVLTVVVIALLIATLAIFLLRIGVLLNRTADDLDDCAQNVKNISYQAEVIGPGVVRINETGTTVLGALPLLCDGAESVAVAKGAPYVDPSEARSTAYADHSEARSTVPPVATPVMASSTVSPRGVGYLDEEGGSLGYLDES
jgi:HAMP domain-containing protein